jgi:hypothetical protein
MSDLAIKALHHPFTMIVCGPSGSGKTRWVLRLCKNLQLLYPMPTKILWYYGVMQPEYKDLKNATFIPGISDESLEDVEKNTLLIIDDLMIEGGKSEAVQKMFTQGIHHRLVSVILLLNNLFHQSPNMRSIQLNTQYMVLLRSRDQTQIEVIGRQLMGKDWRFFVNAYKQATSQMFGYLFVDLKAETPPELQLSTHIFESPVFFLRPSQAGSTKRFNIIQTWKV